MTTIELSTTDKYVAHSLQLIRLANGWRRDVDARLTRLSLIIRRIVGGADPITGIGRRQIAGLMREINDEVSKAYSAILDLQKAETTELIQIETNWAAKAGRYKVPNPEVTLEKELAKASRDFQIMGNTLQEKWTQEAQELSNRIVAQLRLGANAGQTNPEIIKRIVGTGPQNAGGVMAQTKQRAAGITDAAAHAAADVGRREAMRANGVNAVMWHGVLDNKICPTCGIRSGKLWDMDGQPIGHDIPWYPPPLHPWCRCIYIPQKFPNGPPVDGGRKADSFENFLDKLSEQEQNDLLGKGRAQLWRDDKITMLDLIGQNGLVLDLRDIRAIVDNM